MPGTFARSWAPAKPVTTRRKSARRRDTCVMGFFPQGFFARGSRGKAALPDEHGRQACKQDTERQRAGDKEQRECRERLLPRGEARRLRRAQVPPRHDE